MGREHFYEARHIASQMTPTSKRNFRHTRLKKMRSIQGDEICILFLIERHTRHDTDAELEANIGFDDVGICGRKYYVGSQRLLRKRLIEFRSTREAKVIGD